MGASHHDGSDGPVPEALADAMREHFDAFRRSGDAMVPNLQLGKTEDYPQGMYGPSDEGGVRLAIGHDDENQRVVVDFGTPVTWVGFDPDQALHVARMLVEHAMQAKGKARAQVG